MKLMKSAVWVMMVGIGLSSSAFSGTAPRDGAEKYAAHAEQNGVGIGATLLTSSQARKIFRTDVNRCCVVVEVALYPQKDAPSLISLDDLTLRILGQDVGAKPSSTKVAAWRSSHDSDRLRPRLIEAMELELAEKSLPEGRAATPVSGYVYFPLANAKKAKYQLEYMLNGAKVVLALN